MYRGDLSNFLILEQGDPLKYFTSPRQCSISHSFPSGRLGGLGRLSCNKLIRLVLSYYNRWTAYLDFHLFIVFWRINWISDLCFYFLPPRPLLRSTDPTLIACLILVYQYFSIISDRINWSTHYSNYCLAYLLRSKAAAVEHQLVWLISFWFKFQLELVAHRR